MPSVCDTLHERGVPGQAALTLATSAGGKPPELDSGAHGKISSRSGYKTTTATP